MKNILFQIFISGISLFGFAQSGWTWTPLDTIPERVSNNAVCEAVVNGQKFVYSFSGIDSTKVFSGIHLKSYKYDVTNNSWSSIADLPDTLGKIAAGASCVNDKIYIIGGYHVFSNGNELSSNKVHVYNPSTDSYESDANPIPVAIDDHVQSVWRDSLIYVVTGWSDVNNVPDVQIFNPYNDTWQAGTSTPNDNYYKSFGASGTIIGDTIIYNGGVRSGFNFAAVPFTRRGIINPTDPTDITWELMEDNPGATGYRMACSSYDNMAFWVGGGGTAYNYNGLSYSNNSGVQPLERILRYTVDTDLWFEGPGAPYHVMDLRGIAKISSTSWIIAGGMEANQKVSNKSYLIEIDPLLLDTEEVNKELTIYPNPVRSQLNFEGIDGLVNLKICSILGEVISVWDLPNESIDVSSLAAGLYLIQLELNDGATIIKEFVKE